MSKHVEIIPHDRRRGLGWLLMPMEIMVTPHDGEVLVDRWWIADDRNRLLFMISSISRWTGYDNPPIHPQCNRDISIVEKTMENEMYSGIKPHGLLVKVVFMSNAYAACRRFIAWEQKRNEKPIELSVALV